MRAERSSVTEGVFVHARITSSLRAAERQRLSTRIFTLVTGCRATRENNGFTFTLQELLPDKAGDIVIRGNAGDVTILTDDLVIDRGISSDHVTRTGHAVLGLAYCRFADGVTVFYPRRHSLSVKYSELV
jgi:hypothetical protein